MNLKEFLENLILKAKEKGIDAEAHGSYSQSLNVESQNGEISSQSSNISQFVSFRALINGQMGYAYTEALDNEAVDMLIKGVIDSANLCEDVDEKFLFEGAKQYPQIKNTIIDDNNVKLEDFIERIDIINKTILNYSNKIDQVAYVKVESNKNSVYLLNTKGMNLYNSDNIYAAFAEAIAKEEADITTAYDLAFSRNLNNIDVMELANKVAGKAVAALNAQSIKSGQYNVVFHNEAMSALLSVFEFAFSAENVQKGLSLLLGKEGEVIAAPCVQLIDDPLLVDGTSSTPFDSEGVPTKTKNIIENGVLTTLLHNLKTAKKAGIETTGNAGYSGTAVRSFNLHFAKGKDSLETMLQNIGDCIVIRELEGLHSGANPISGDFSLSAKGYMVENGKRQGAVSQITVASNFYTLLKNIVCFANDLRFPMGETGSPSAFVGKLSIAGK